MGCPKQTYRAVLTCKSMLSHIRGFPRSKTFTFLISNSLFRQFRIKEFFRLIFSLLVYRWCLISFQALLKKPANLISVGLTCCRFRSILAWLCSSFSFPASSLLMLSTRRFSSLVLGLSCELSLLKFHKDPRKTALLSFTSQILV